MRRLFLLCLLFVAARFSACSPICDGVEVDGRCEKACTDEACAPNTKCYENACRAPCSQPEDCLPGQDCRRVTTDHGSTGDFCIGPRSSPGSIEGTDGDPCAANAECAARLGYHCIGAACRLTCDFHGHCGSRGSCSGVAEDDEGNPVRLCEDDGFPRGTGEFGTACPNGDADCAEGFVCHGVGPGDAAAYCTREGCTADSECPSGSFCSSETALVANGEVQRTRRMPCDDACGFGASSDDACIPSSEIGPGKKYTCAPYFLAVNVCLHREFCTPCESDTDCMGEPNQVCARDDQGVKTCTVRCTPGGSSCPWGNSAQCALTDPDVGYETCSHRFGSCTGTGKSCEPCVEHTDCPSGWCERASFTGERYCIDTSTTCSCKAGTNAACIGGGCPTTPEPGSLPMTCLGGEQYEDSALFGMCFGAKTDPTQPSKESCWPG